MKRFKSEEGDPTIKQEQMLCRVPNVRDALGMDAAIALDWFNDDTTVNQESEQRLDLLSNIDVINGGANAAAVFNFQAGDIGDFVLAGNPLGATADTVSDAIDAVQDAVDEALCGLNDGNFSPANWLAMLTGLADRIEDLGKTLSGGLGGDPVLEGFAKQFGFSFSSVETGFTTIAGEVRKYTDYVLPPEEWVVAFNQGMDDIGMSEVSLELVEVPNIDVFNGECPDPESDDPIRYTFLLDFGDSLDWTAGETTDIIDQAIELFDFEKPDFADNFKLMSTWDVGVDVNAALGFGLDLDATSPGDALL